MLKMQPDEADQPRPGTGNFLQTQNLCLKKTTVRTGAAWAVSNTNCVDMSPRSFPKNIAFTVPQTAVRTERKIWIFRTGAGAARQAIPGQITKVPTAISITLMI